MTQIEKYIKRLKNLQSMYDIGQPQHNTFGIAINEAKEMLIKDISICQHNWVKKFYKDGDYSLICKKCKEIR